MGRSLEIHRTQGTAFISSSPIRPKGKMRSSGEIEIEVDSGFAAKPLDLDLNLDLHKTFALCESHTNNTP